MSVFRVLWLLAEGYFIGWLFARFIDNIILSSAVAYFSIVVVCAFFDAWFEVKQERKDKE